MSLQIESRSSESAWIQSVWSSRSEDVSEMTSVASETWGLVFWEQGTEAFAAVTGPESRTRTAQVPEDARFAGIQFTVGTSLRLLPTAALVDGGITLPDTTDRRFWLDGSRWQTPGVDDAELFVSRLVRAGAVVRDSVVDAVLQGQPVAGTDRTVERRFRAATGFSRGAIAQIERARAAAELLVSGEPVSDVVALLGYYDEPHLARALRRLVGRTAGQLRSGAGGEIALCSSANDVVHDLENPVGISVGLAEH